MAYIGLKYKAMWLIYAVYKKLNGLYRLYIEGYMAYIGFI